MSTRGLAVVALLALTGCSVIVAGGDGDPVRCVPPEVGQADPCQALGPDWRCQGEFCQQGCEAESCDGEDDDCDGTVDEDLDDDDDGFTWCPTGPGARDCDDSDAMIHPASDGAAAPPDGCDGKDNDCDSSTPDGATCAGDTICDVTSCTEPDCTPQDRCVMINCANRDICVEGQFCDHSTTPPSCQASSMSCLDAGHACTSPQRCNPENGMCVSAQPTGMPCNFDAECASNLCVHSDALRLATEDVGGATGLCSHACCDDGDCDPDETCWDSGSGARACVDTALLASGPNGAPTIPACLDSSECASGVCGLRGEDAYTLSNRFTLGCGPAFGSVQTCTEDYDCWTWTDATAFCAGGTCRYEECSSNADCPSGICIGRCADPCRTADDCPAGDMGDAAASCEYAYVTSEGRKDVFPVCFYRSRGSASESGAPCASHSECRDDLCVDALGRTDPPEGTPKACAGTCCNDSQCGSGQCRPLFVGTSWEMRCLPRRTFDQGGHGATSG